MRAIRLSAKDARALFNIVEPGRVNSEARAVRDAFDRLQAALAPKPKRPSVKRKEAKRVTKREATSAIREEVAKRDGDRCCACGRDQGVFPAGLQMDHFFGRARAESVETCWLLCWYCHSDKTHNNPSAKWWLERFMNHALQHGYGDAAEAARKNLAFARAKAELMGRAAR